MFRNDGLPEQFTQFLNCVEDAAREAEAQRVKAGIFLSCFAAVIRI